MNASIMRPIHEETFPATKELEQVNYRCSIKLLMKCELQDSVLISESRIAERISDMARKISHDFLGTELLAVVVLRGGFIFASDLLRKIDPTVSVRVDFVSASSYGAETVSTGNVRILMDLHDSVEGANALIIDDILETGETLTRIRDLIEERGAASVRTATLLQKEGKLKRPFAVDYLGFQIPDQFVVGYGLDFAGRYRNLSDIRVLNESSTVRSPLRSF